tara:strand:+ start:197 stop:1696 length:1500 start_codon:yes stop_codon:yes gene_type:complete
MTEIELYNHLSKAYNVVCIVDMASITKLPSSIFKLFNKHHKESFSPIERLILYSSEQPSVKLLTHIQKAAFTIDISNDFILICCPFDITNVLTNVGKDYRMDTPIQSQVMDINSTLKLNDNFYISDTVCPEAWSHLEIKQQGNIFPCCVQSSIVGNIVKDNLTDVFYSDTMSALRNDLLNGVKVPGCSNCWKTENAGQRSNRQQRLQLRAKEFYTEWIDNPAIRSLDIKPGNVCNFKCRVCGPGSSSLHAIEKLTHETNPSSIIKIKNNIANGKWADDIRFLTELEVLLPQLTNLDFYGGEPFLLKQLPIILQKAIDIGVAKNIRLHFNSNGSIFPDKLIPMFAQFREVDIALSIDNIGNRFEMERGGQWHDVEKNIIKFLALPVRTYIFPTINIQNVLFFEEILEWAEKIGIDVTYNLLHEPKYLNINYMTKAARQLVIDRFNNTNHEILRTITTQINNSAGSDGAEFIRYMKEYDHRRSEDFSLTHKEIAHAMGYVL